MNPIFNNDTLMLQLNVVHKLRKVLQREKQGHQNRLHRRFGVGLSEAEFAFCVSMLELSRWCTVDKGERGGVILTLNEDFANINLPEVAEVR